MIARLTVLYLGIFAGILGIISALAFWLIGREYASLLAPALTTPEGTAGYRTAMLHVAAAIGGIDLPLLVIVGVLAYILARSSLAPLIAAQERERQFAADAAHELRSPLATIATVAQAARAQADGELHQAFDTITTTALDASALIGDLLTLSRNPRWDLLESEPLDLAFVVEACAREFEPRLPDSITLKVEKTSTIVHGDQRRLRELLRNLLDNAVKHAQTTITIESGQDSRCGYMRVTDDGPGVPLELRNRIFDRFFSEDGSGLGLAISQWVAHAHNGSLILEETPYGASFLLRLPFPYHI